MNSLESVKKRLLSVQAYYCQLQVSFFPHISCLYWACSKQVQKMPRKQKSGFGSKVGHAPMLPSGQENDLTASKRRGGSVAACPCWRCVSRGSREPLSHMLAFSRKHCISSLVWQLCLCFLGAGSLRRLSLTRMLSTKCCPTGSASPSLHAVPWKHTGCCSEFFWFHSLFWKRCSSLLRPGVCWL